MSMHPVRFGVEHPSRMGRMHVVIRLLFVAVLATIGWSSIHWVVYLAAPVLVALLISAKGAERYLSEDAPAIVRALRWLAAAYAYLWLLTDAFPTGDAAYSADLEVEPTGAPTPGSALLRLLYSLPALLLFAVLSLVAGILWPIGALVILVVGHIPAWISDFLTLTVRFQFRLYAYHLSLVDRYPAIEDASSMTHDIPHSGAV
jgi:hypothetical protein